MPKVIPAIGKPWPEQGGIFIGSRLIDGAVHHVVIPGGIEHDTPRVAFADVENAVATKGEINGKTDWRAPDQEDLMLAYINARQHFNPSSYYWSRSEHHGWPWLVVFERGLVDGNGRHGEFRVRPVRSFPDSSL